MKRTSLVDVVQCLREVSCCFVVLCVYIFEMSTLKYTFALDLLHKTTLYDTLLSILSRGRMENIM